MADDARPTNDRILTLLEAISRQLEELREVQAQMATDLKEVARTGR